MRLNPTKKDGMELIELPPHEFQFCLQLFLSGDFDAIKLIPCSIEIFRHLVKKYYKALTNYTNNNHQESHLFFSILCISF